jgi:Zn-dependent protease with chaperone function
MQARTKVDERVLGAGTTLRFGLLLVLFTVSSASMMWDHIILRRLLGDPNNDGFGCTLAGGYDPEVGDATNFGAMMGHNAQPLDACMARYVPAWWAPVLVIAFLITAAGGLYWWLPAWKGRRSRVVPLDDIDHQGDLSRLLAELVSVAGLHRSPHFVVDPAAATTSALAFGRPRHYTVCLHGGLVARRFVDRESFRAVILHELAHIRNGDVGITYATISLWRVFLIAMLLPYVARQVQLLFSGQFLRTDSITSVAWPGDVSQLTSSVLLSAFTVVLVYLSRADILRSREIYADLAAVDWGAAPASWHHGAHGGVARSRLGSLLVSFAELWLTHPRWDRRKHSLTDSSGLFGVYALPTFMTGVAAILVSDRLGLFPGIRSLDNIPSIRSLDNTLAYGAGSWLAAGLITGIIGGALWRATTHAILTGSRVPSGFWAGVWLGCGLVAGELLLHASEDNQWLPSRPALLLVLILVAVVITCWTTQCAELWIKIWRGSTLRPAALLTLVGMWILVAFWISWWNNIGYLYLIGLLPDRAESQELLGTFSGSTIVAVYLVVLTFGPLIVWAATVLWLLPLLAWIMPSGTESPHWVRRASPKVHHPASPEGELPSLRRILLAAVLGGASSWIAVAAVMAYRDSSPMPIGQRDDLVTLIHEAWLVLALTAGPVVTAVVMGTVAAKYRLPVALVAAGVATLLGLTGLFLLIASKGCFGPMNMTATVCHWRPRAAWMITKELTPNLLGIGVFATVVAVLLATAVANLIRRLTRLDGRRPIRGPRIANRQSSLAIRRICVAVICVAVLGLAATIQVSPQPASSNQSGFRGQLAADLTATSSPSPKVRKSQVLAWGRYGGADIILDLVQIADSIDNNLSALQQMPDLDAALKDEDGNVIPLRSACADMERWTKKADSYFLIPDPQEQLIWSNVLTEIKRSSADCQGALAQRNATLLETSINEISTALNHMLPVTKWLNAQLVGVK